MYDKFAFLQGSVANKFYVHNDIFRYEDEVFGDSEAELEEGKLFTKHPIDFVFVYELLADVFMVECKATPTNKFSMYFFFLT